ncbi:hypothetical protein AURDEDRAFT_175327 [Auricularia subglabra TFB-10046 SS5]|nr:hypothetical protein AURDEDRAFT_175327 [Auricularia subglabra TFB-10046 SS5]
MSMLKKFSIEDRIQPADAARFEVIWSRIDTLAPMLPAPTVHDHRGGQDNYGRRYEITARISIMVRRPALQAQQEPDDRPLCGPRFERRVFHELDSVGYCYGRGSGSNEYFYYNPDGDFYCHYVDKGGRHGRKFMYDQILKFKYPPDVPSSENGGLAERYKTVADNAAGGW